MNNEDLQNHILSIEKKIDSTLPKVHLPGLINGKCGVALFYLYLWLYTKSDLYRKKAIQTLEQSIETVNHDRINFSFSTGLSGIAWTIEHFKNQEIISESATDILGELEQQCSNVSFSLLENENFDYLHGGIGFGIYCLEKSNEKEANSTLVKMEQLINSKSILTNNGITWEAKFNKWKPTNIEFNLGTSHGIPSIIYFLSKIRPTELNKETVQQSVKWLKSVFYKENTVSVIPERIVNGVKEPETSKLAWCYGDLGVSTSLINLLPKGNLDQDFLGIALNSVKRIRDKGDVDVKSMETGLCHGVSGLAHMYNKLYVLSGVEEFRTAADSCYETLIKEDIEMNNDISFLDGLSGVGLSCLSRLSNENLAWDKTLLLS